MRNFRHEGEKGSPGGLRSSGAREGSTRPGDHGGQVFFRQALRQGAAGLVEVRGRPLEPLAQGQETAAVLAVEDAQHVLI